MATHTYQFGALILQVQAAEHQHRQIAQCWQQLFRIAPIVGESALGSTATILLGPPGLPGCAVDCANPQLVAHFGQIQLYQTEHGFQYICGTTVLQIDSRMAQASGHLSADLWASSLVEQRYFWQSILFHLARRLHCHLLHANALYPPGLGPKAGVLVVGNCGAGKTTLALSLVAAGWHYVTDDSVDPSVDPGVDDLILAHAVRRGFACSAQTAVHWPSLAPLIAAGPALNRHKTLIDLDLLYPTSFAPQCWPRLLLFPRISGAAQSRVTPVTSLQSFTTLVGQPYNGLLSDTTLTPALLTLFQALVTQTQAYQFDAGWDVFAQPTQVSDLIMRTLLATVRETA